MADIVLGLSIFSILFIFLIISAFCARRGGQTFQEFLFDTSNTSHPCHCHYVIRNVGSDLSYDSTLQVAAVDLNDNTVNVNNWGKNVGRMVLQRGDEIV